jgi:hypothetical protein
VGEALVIRRFGVVISMLLGIVAAVIPPAVTASPPVPGTTTAAATVTVQGNTYQFTGVADCTYTGDGSIFGAPAAAWHAMWTARERADLPHVNANLWQLKAGGDPMVNLAVTVGAANYQITTVRGGPIAGAATARAERKGAGGVLTIEGRTADGTALKAVIACSAFHAPEDNG